MRYMPLLLLLASCSASGETYQGTVAPFHNHANLIIYRESNMLNSLSTYWVEVNGKQVCDLHQNSYMVLDVMPGKINIASSKFASVGTSRITVNPKANETIYVKMEVNGNKAYIGALGGMIAQSIDEGMSASDGPVYLGEVNKKSATLDLNGMHLEPDCK